MLIALAIDIVQRYAEDEVVFLRWPRLAQASLLALSLFFTFIISQAEQSEPFIYQGF
jgi:hypothetical protein